MIRMLLIVMKADSASRKCVGFVIQISENNVCHFLSSSSDI